MSSAQGVIRTAIAGVYDPGIDAGDVELEVALVMGAILRALDAAGMVKSALSVLSVQHAESTWKL